MTDQHTEEEPDRRKNPAELTFMDTQALSRYVTDTGKILPRKYTRLTPKWQRRVSRLIKTARQMQLMK